MCLGAVENERVYVIRVFLFGLNKARCQNGRKESHAFIFEEFRSKYLHIDPFEMKFAKPPHKKYPQK